MRYAKVIMRKKRTYDITHRVIRVRAGDYAFLAEISRQFDVPMAEALHQVITDQAKRESLVISRTQIPMPVFAAKPKPILSVNGDKHIAIVVTPKGGKIQ